MFLSKNFVLGASCLLFTVVNAANCANGPWTDVLEVGGDGGSEFCATKWEDGVVISGVEVWATTKAVRAIQFYYSDGTNSDQIGKADGDRHARLDWDPATDNISQLKLWGNGRGQYTGRVQIRTRSGKELDVGKDTGGQDTFDIKTASGIMLGAFGLAGNSIDSLGFLFLKSKVKKVSIDDVVFSETPEELNKRMEGLETVTLDYADHTNQNNDTNQTFTFGKSETRSTSKRWSNTATNSFGFSTATEISGKILDLGASSTTTLSYTYSKANTEETGEDKSVTLTYSVATTLKPGQRVYCRATAMKGTYKGDYSSTVNIWLEDGEKFGFSKGGTMEQVAWSKASSVCQDKDFGPSEKKIGRSFVA